MSGNKIILLKNTEEGEKQRNKISVNSMSPIEMIVTQQKMKEVPTRNPSKNTTERVNNNTVLPKGPHKLLASQQLMHQYSVATSQSAM